MRPSAIISAAIVMTLIVLLAPAIRAHVSFEEPLLLNDGVSAEGKTPVGDVATDGAGTWIVAGAGTLTFGASNIIMRRSTDGGRTWSLPIQIDDEGAIGHGIQMAASGSEWLAVWALANLGIVHSQSTDGGLTWAAPVLIAPETADGVPYELVTDRLGTWIVAWAKGTATRTIHVSRSDDGGQNWTTTDLGASSSSSNAKPHLATDRQGTWVAVWHGDDGAELSRVFYSRSVDGGISWSLAASLDTTAGAANAQEYPDVLSDGPGAWAAVWPDFEQNGIFLSRSTDGSDWDSPVSLHSRGPALEPWSDRYLSFASEGNGRWVVAWSSNSVRSIGGDADVLFTRTIDGGSTWLMPATMNLDAAMDQDLNYTYHRNDYISDVEADSSGTWVGQYAQTDHCCGPDRVSFVRSTQDCPSAPPAGCKQTLEPGAAKIVVRNDRLFRDSVQWKWKGAPNLSGEFGDPLSTADFAFCLYDQSGGSDVLVFEREARGGATCAEHACWRQTGSGYKYRDRNGLIGATRQIGVQSSVSRARLKFRASGPALLPPNLPLIGDSHVRAVLLNLETGACWQADFSSPVSNAEDGYRASSD